MNILKIPYRVNEQGVRGVAIQVFIISIVTILTKSAIPVIILFLDFFIRAFLSPNLSPLALISKKIIVPVTRFRKRMIVFKPKRFAAGIGLFMTLIASVLLINNLVFPAIIVLIILSLFSFLEAAFSFCAGCKIFGLLIKIGLLPEDECTDCVLGDGDGI